MQHGSNLTPQHVLHEAQGLAPRPAKGTPYRHILETKVVGGREWQYHATKGWRFRRIPKEA